MTNAESSETNSEQTVISAGSSDAKVEVPTKKTPRNPKKRDVLQMLRTFIQPNKPKETPCIPERAVLSEQLGMLERRIDSFNVTGSILLAGFGLLLTIILNLNLPTSTSGLSFPWVIFASRSSLNNMLLISVIIPLVSATLFLIALYNSLRMRIKVSLAALDPNTTLADEQFSRELNKRARLVEVNRVLITLFSTGFYFELLLTLLLLIIAWDATHHLSP